jgi:NAD(P)-dependent dehydrogenase (short-subunit alcohol dehydrogenase family)
MDLTMTADAHPVLLSGKRVIVAGSARGIGASAVRALAAAGAQVAALDLEPAGEAVAQAANDAGPGAARFFRCDVSDRGQTTVAVDAAAGWMGGLDALLHIAGIQRYIPAESITDADWDLMLGVNAHGVVHTNQAAFPHLKGAGGRIINFASAAGMNGLRGCAHYAASKGAVLAWTRTIAQEWAGYGISANAVAPGMWTPMYDTTRSRLDPEALAAHERHMAQAVPLGGRLGDPDRDMAPVLVFLVSDAARFINGQTLAVDGGMMIVR